MKKSYLSLLIFILLYNVSVAQKKPVLKFEVENLAHCESVVFDAPTNLYYVSVMADDEEGDGSIATVTPEGKIKNLKFISGLNNPKGIAIKGTKLYVSDETFLVEANLDDGEILNKYRGYHAKSLNDVAIDAEGKVYVSDMGNSSIYRLDNQGNFKQWFQSEDLQTPNGLLFSDNELYIAGWANNKSKDTMEPKGGFLKMDLSDKKVMKVTASELGHLDGIQHYDKDSFLVSSWASGEIFKISKTGTSEVILKVDRSVGDLLYLSEKNILALPMNIQNKLVFYSFE